MGPGTKWAQLPEAPLLPKREAGSGWDGRGNDQGQSFYETLTLPQRGGRATNRLQASGDLPAAAGAGSWREVKWIGEAEAELSWTTGDAHEWSSRIEFLPPPWL